MGDIICKWRVANVSNLIELVDMLPHEELPNDVFRDRMGAGFMRTPYQLACQLGLYYIDDNNNYIPRFKKSLNEQEAEEYLHHWILRYYAPNPYTPSFRKELTDPIALVPSLVEYAEKFPGASYEDACEAIYGESIGNTGSIMGAINNYSKVIEIDRDHNIHLLPNYKEVLMADRYAKSSFFMAFEDSGEKPLISDKELQVIYFGAPGTGKSHTIKEYCRKYEHYRITFHPDTDYASFVGSYKPITQSEQVYTNMGDKAIPLKDSVSGEPVTTTKISYQYVFQPFLTAYIAAWRELQNEEPKPVFLIIEEINRGNCAQIFGDIFQLLDRHESGFSDYPIVADNDLRKELAREFSSLVIPNADNINDIYNEDVIAKVKSGTHLLLPNNLYIWATMNTSDQSLFPIDSAFKRRWDWKYVKISDSHKGFVISVNGKKYDWWQFVEAINRHIGNDTNQEDKKIGYFFAKAIKNADGELIISADKFLSKVIFFIYNDVYKDFGLDDAIFKDEVGNEMAFADYFDEHGDTMEDRVELFLRNLGLKFIGEDASSEPDSTTEGSE